MNFSTFARAFIAHASTVLPSRCLLLAFFSFSTLSIITIGEAKPAQAWFKICNQSTETVSTAFSYLNVSSNRLGGVLGGVFGGSIPQSNKGWTSQGWWTLNPGACAEVYPADLSERNSYFYVYAKGSDGGLWGGNKRFCVDPSSEFIVDSANKNCSGRGEWRGFNEVYTGDSRNYTYRLTD